MLYSIDNLLVAVYKQSSPQVVVQTFESQMLQMRFPPGSLITTRIFKLILISQANRDYLIKMSNILTQYFCSLPCSVPQVFCFQQRTNI